MPKVFLDPDRQSQRDIDRAIKNLRKKSDTCGILKKVQEKVAYEKPTTKRKRKQAAAIARHRRELAKTALPERQH